MTKSFKFTQYNIHTKKKKNSLFKIMLKNYLLWIPPNLFGVF